MKFLTNSLPQQVAVRGRILCLAAALILAAPGFSAGSDTEVCHHDLKVELQPEKHRLLAQDDICLDRWKGGDLNLLLSDKGNVKSVLVDGTPSAYSFRSGKLTLTAAPAMDRPLCVSISFDAVFNDTNSFRTCKL